MFFILLVLTFFMILILDLIGKSVKRIFQIDLKGFNLFIGYLFSLFLFFLTYGIFIAYGYSIDFMESLFPLFLIILIPFIIPALKLHINYDWVIIVIILLYLFYFFTLTFIVPEEINQYFYNLHHFQNVNVYQTFTLLLAKFFHLEPLVFTVNVMSFINLFIILVSVADFLSILMKNERQIHLAFLFFLFLFTVLNTSINNIIIAHNAYYFIYQPFTGISIYLYALIPFQIILFYKYEDNYNILLLLINLSVYAFTSFSLVLQVLLNVAFICSRFINYKKSTNIIFYTLIPHFIPLVLFNYEHILMLWLTIIITILFLIDSILYKKELVRKMVGLGLIALWGIIIIYLISKKDLYGLLNTDSYSYLNTKKGILILYYILSVYALIKLRKEKKDIRNIFIVLPMIILLMFFNPLTIYFFVKNNVPLNLTLYLMPLTFSIVYVFFNLTTIIEKTLIILLIISQSGSIFSSLKPIYMTDQNPYYRLDQDVLDISTYINQNENIKKFLVCESLINKISINTKTSELLLGIDDNLLLMHYTINDQIPFDYHFFINMIQEYDIDAIIIDEDKQVNKDIAILSQSSYHFDYYIIYEF